METTKTVDSPAPITFEDFVKLDLRVGTVIEAEPHPNADKLMVLKVNLGTEVRQIVAGIRSQYPLGESLKGKQIIVVANLPPRGLRGVESHGMLLAAKDFEALALLTLDKPLQAGSKVG
jgi:methionyl-tRNA synthetase